MFIRVERGSSIPISRQIAEQIRAQCLSGVLKPGDTLPAVRRLAQQLAVNVNTVLRVYERLAADRLIEMRHGDGTYVLPQSTARGASRLLTEQRDQYTREFDAIIRRGRLLGLGATELRRMLTLALTAAKSGLEEERAVRARRDRALIRTQQRPKSMSESAISIRNLCKSFGRKTVLEDVTLDVSHGQTIALLGRNGAGKTTLIRILLGLIPSDSGTVRVLDREPAREPIELRSRVGYLAEDQTMYGWMTPIELCRFLEPFYPTWDARLADEFLDRFELPRRGRIRHLSKGQSVKLGLAVALAHRPRLAILDDPAIGLDPIARKEFNRDLVDQLQAEGRTVLYSSHLLDEVEAVADSVAILHGGRIVRHSPTEPLRETVKQVVLPLEATDVVSPPAGLLDVRRHEERLVLTVDGAKPFVEQLATRGVEHEVVDLSLDEIFEAFVIGRPQAWLPPLAAALLK